MALAAAGVSGVLRLPVREAAWWCSARQELRRRSERAGRMGSNERLGIRALAALMLEAPAGY